MKLYSVFLFTFIADSVFYLSTQATCKFVPESTLVGWKASILPFSPSRLLYGFIRTLFFFIGMRYIGVKNEIIKSMSSLEIFDATIFVLRL